MEITIDFWNKNHHNNFKKIAKYFKKNRQVSIIEIGTYEGRTSEWLIKNIGNSNIIAIDPDPCTNFYKNVEELYETSRFNWIKGYSHEVLHSLKGNMFDFIYVDGSHHASSVLEDAILSWRLLKNNGILLFDDYLMKVMDDWFYKSYKEFNESFVWQHPKHAIDAFLSIYKGQYKMFIDNYQVGIIKKCSLESKNI
ncbi:MAG: class I SAM-dependent methyltransferase [Nanoarchaeota archaeon]